MASDSDATACGHVAAAWRDRSIFLAARQPARKQQPLLDQPHAVGERYRELERMRAVELAIEHGGSQSLVPRGRRRRRSNRRIDCSPA